MISIYTDYYSQLYCSIFKVHFYKMSLCDVAVFMAAEMLYYTLNMMQ